MDAALKVCAADDACAGVTKESDSNYRANTGSTLSASASRTAYLQRSPVVLYSRNYFSKLTGFKAGGINKKKSYKDEKSAAKACLASNGCTGFVLYLKKYYTATSWVS